MMKIEKCPHGEREGKCVFVGCVFQLDKWKGKDIPTIEVKQSKDGFFISCEDFEAKE